MGTEEGRLIALQIEKLQDRLEGIYESDSDYWGTAKGIDTICDLEEELNKALMKCQHINSDGNFVTKRGICMVCSAPV